MALIRFPGLGVISILISFSLAGEVLAQSQYLFLTSFPESQSFVLLDSSATISQPVFNPGGSVLYYIAQKDEGFRLVQYDVPAGQQRTIHHSSSPMKYLQITVDGKYLTWIDQNNKRLARLSLQGGSPQTILSDVDFEEYVWLSDNALLLVKPGKPNSLVLATQRPKREIPIARHVGTALAPLPKQSSYAFVHKLSVDSWSIKLIQPDGTIAIMAETLPEAEVFGVSFNDFILYYDDQIHRYNSRTGRWNSLSFPKLPGKIISMNFNPTGDTLAFWAQKNQ